MVIIMLMQLGWTPFTRYGDNLALKLCRGVLVGFWLIVIFITCLTQILSCFRRDSVSAGGGGEGGRGREEGIWVTVNEERREMLLGCSVFLCC